MSDNYAGADADQGTTRQFQRSRGIKSDARLDLVGPQEIVGSVRSGASIAFDGDFIVKGNIDAYGAISVNGSLASQYVTPNVLTMPRWL